MSKARGLADLGNVYNDGALSNRNLIINGSMQVSQRGDFSAPTQLPSSQYFVDRWYFDTNNTGSSAAVVNADITELATAVKAVRIVANITATSYLGIRQKLEYPEKYFGKTYTYSAYVRSNNTNARLTAYLDGAGQIIASTPHTGGGGWERLSVTFTFSSTPALTAYFDVFLASSVIDGVAVTAGDYLEVTGVQLEVGDVATPFEHKVFSDELARCMRYFEAEVPTWGTPRSSDNVIHSPGYFKVQKRSTPTMTLVLDTYSKNPSIQKVNADYYVTYVTGTASTSLDATFDADAEL